MYNRGEGVPKDAVEAVKWFHKAAEQGTEFGKIARGARAGNMTPQQIAEAQKLSRERKPKN